MKLKLDPTLPYALALEGGGAKGAYQIGAWKALRETGISVSAVSGTSVGALNGALIAMDALETAEEVWQNIRYSQVMDVDDETMHKLLRGDLRDLDLRSAAETIRTVFGGGLDITPLYDWLTRVIDEKAVKASPTELYIVTFAVKEQKELELRARDLPDGTLHDMLLASSYLPVFRSERLGKRYADGGVRDVLPLHVLLQNGCKNIIALRLYGIGLERRVRIPKDVTLHTIAPTVDLGSTLDFTAEQSRLNLKAGYFDAQRLLYGLGGTKWYLHELWEEARAYAFLRELLREKSGEASLRALHEEVFPLTAKTLGVKGGDYAALLLTLLETAAEEAGLERWRIYSETELIEALQDKLCPAAVSRLLEKRRSRKK